MRKRVPTPKAKAGELKAAWGRADRYDKPDICYAWGDGVPRGDGHFIHNAFSETRYRPSMVTFPALEEEPSFLAELEARGYDLTTLKFSIQKKAQADG